MAQNETWINHDMLNAVKVQYLDGNLFSMDNAGNLIGVILTRGGDDYSGGGDVSASVIRADGGTVSVVGALSGNVATVVLPQAAYAVPGAVSIVVKLTVGGEVTTIAAVVANVYQSSTDSAIDPGTIIPSVQALIAAIDTAVASIPADYSALWTSLAPAFSTSTNYTAGQYVTYNGGLYRFTVDHAAGAWNSAHATAANIGADLSSLKSAISPIVLFSGTTKNNDVILTKDDIYEAKTFYYDFDVVTGVASYIEFMDSNNQRISYIGKGSSASGVLHYEGQIAVPSNFSYAKVTISTTDARMTINGFGIYPSTEYYAQSLDAITKSNEVQPIVLYSGSPLAGINLFTKDDTFGAETIFYKFDVASGYASYIEFMDSNNQRISYIGKGSSESCALHYEGKATLPAGFSYARWISTASNAVNTIDYISIFPQSDYYVQSIDTNQKVKMSINESVNYYTNKNVISSNGADAFLSYGFSLRYIQMRNGDGLYISADNYSFNIAKYDIYGTFIGLESSKINWIDYTAIEDCFISVNVICMDKTITFNNDYIEKSGLHLYCSFESTIRKDSGQIVNRVCIPATQHGDSCRLRIPTIKIMPNFKYIVAYEKRDTYEDLSPSNVGYSIINNGQIESFGIIANKEEGEIRQFNPQIYIKENGNVLVLWTSNDSEENCHIHYSLSSDYGATWSEVYTIQNTSSSGENILTAPANGVFVDDKILIPVYKAEGINQNMRSGLMLIDLEDFSHIEKFVPTGNALNECNVFVNGNVAFLTCRQDASGAYRHIYTIDTALVGNYTERTNFYITSKYRPICQESYFKTSNYLYMTIANTDRYGIKLYVSDNLSRTWTELVQLVNVRCGGYSCIDIKNNTIAVCTEGADEKYNGVDPNNRGRFIFADTVVIGSTI